MITIGTRGSALALAQTGWVRDRLLDRFPGLDLTIKIIKTSADRNQTASLHSSSSVGVFVKELEQALIAGEIDIAVHSMKDLPTTIPEQLQITAVPEREDARDAFVSARWPTLSDMPEGSIVGTGSIRRQSQLLAFRPDLQIVDIRGNVDTRLSRLQEGKYDAVILACAGLNRLGLHDRISSPLSFSQMLPAPGQGALAIETRVEDSVTNSAVSTLDHRPTALAISAERTFLYTIGGGCNVPAAVYAHLEGGLLSIEGLVASADGKEVVRQSVQAKQEDSNEAAASLANRILAGGGRAILDRM